MLSLFYYNDCLSKKYTKKYTLSIEIHIIKKKHISHKTNLVRFCLDSSLELINGLKRHLLTNRDTNHARLMKNSARQ